MTDRPTAVMFRATFVVAVVLSATAGIAAPTKSTSQEILYVENGQVVTGLTVGARALVLADSQLLRKHKVREILDWRNLAPKNTKRLLLAIGEPLPHFDLHTPLGGELWQVDSDGAERLVSADAIQAKLSPDGEKLLYATSRRTVAVQRADGRVLVEVTRGYDPSWRPDGTSIVLSRADEGRDLNMPEQLRISTIDTETGATRDLTDGAFDDVRAEFHPSGQWVIFVSGARTGLASFWRVSLNGGDARQLTNVGATAVGEHFVPTPFKRTLWSSNGRWFLYDFKVGDKEEVWGLAFGVNGEFVRAMRIATGLNPQWVDDGVSVGVQQVVNGNRTLTVVELPR